MPHLNQKGSPRHRFGEAGVIHILVVLVLLIGIIAGVYLVQHPAIFKPKASSVDISNNPLFRERVGHMRTTFKVPEEVEDVEVVQRVKDDLIKSNIVLEGGVLEAQAEVSILADCSGSQRTNLAFSEYDVFPPLCLSDEERSKALEYVKAGVESAAEFVVPYSQAKQALEFGSDISNTRDLLKKSGIAERNQLSAVSGPDSNFDGYAITLIRIKELETDVKNHPDGLGDLNLDQEEARREYLVALRNLWEKQHNILIELAGVAAVSVIDRPLKVVGDFARPVTGPIIEKLTMTVNPLANFIKRSWLGLVNFGVKTGFNQIERISEAEGSFVKFMLPIFKPEEREQALKMFRRWFTGNYNPNTGKITLYRYIDMSPELLEATMKNGITPRGVNTAGSLENLLKYLEGSGHPWDKQLADVYNKQRAGEDISEFIETFANSSGGGYAYDIVTYWTTEPEFASFLGNRQYRIAVELDPSVAWRDQIAEKAIHQEQTAKLFIEKGLNFEQWKKSEFEWTVLGEIPQSSLKEIKDLSHDEIIYSR